MKNHPHLDPSCNGDACANCPELENVHGVPCIYPRCLPAPSSTPPVETSNPEGGPKGADGQGVCDCSDPCQFKVNGQPCPPAHSNPHTDRIPSYTLTYIAKSSGAEELVVTEGGYSYADASVIVRSLLSTGFCDSVLVERD